MTDTQAEVDFATRRHEEAVLHDACTLAGIGLRDAQSRRRTEEAVRRRAVVAWILHARAGWTQAKTGEALRRSPRQIIRLLRKM